MIEARLIDSMGSDLSVVNAARVSFGKQRDAMGAGDEKLIRFLAEHKHLSPFGHAYASFHVKAPIFVARQLVKHKFLRWNEISRRYVDSDPEFYVPDVWRGRADDVKQGSAGEVKVPYLVPYEFNRSALYEYQTLLEAGVAPEQARMVLPQSTMTEWHWSGSLDAFAAMALLRLSGDTQAESREVATQIDVFMEELFPVSWEALLDYG